MTTIRVGHPGGSSSLTPRWVGITISIVVRSQMDIVACLLVPWSSGKDPDRCSGIRGNSTADDVITVVNGPAFKSLRQHP
jgi:hypothetical protein